MPAGNEAHLPQLRPDAAKKKKKERKKERKPPNPSLTSCTFYLQAS